jgi:hypothetical protein
MARRHVHGKTYGILDRELAALFPRLRELGVSAGTRRLRGVLFFMAGKRHPITPRSSF